MARQLTIESLFSESCSYLKQRSNSLILPVGLMSLLSIAINTSGYSFDSKITAGMTDQDLKKVVEEIPFLILNFFYFLSYLFSFIYIARDIFDIKFFKSDMPMGKRAAISILKIPKCLIFSFIYFFMASVGFAFLVIPGLFLLWVFYYGTTLAVVSDKAYDNFFGNSYNLVMANKGFSFVIIFLAILFAAIFGGFSGLVAAVFGHLGAIVGGILMAISNVVFVTFATMGLIYMLDKTSLQSAPNELEAQENPSNL